MEIKNNRKQIEREKDIAEAIAVMKTLKFKGVVSENEIKAHRKK